MKGPISIFCIAYIIFLPLIGLAQQQAYESPAGTKYLLYTPPGYDTSQATFPLLLSLHSKGEVGDDLTELTNNNPEQMPSRLIYLNRWPQHLPFIVLTPQLKPDPTDPEIQWSAAYIDEVVNHVIQNFRVNLNRIYVTGISRGGTGTWTYASAFPEKIAAILPLSGRSDTTQACAIKDLPVWAFHGDNDEVAPTAYSIDMVGAIKRCQPSGVYKPRLNILNARNHNGWNEVYNGTSGYPVYDWLLMFSKDDRSNKKPYVSAGRDLHIQVRDQPLNIVGDFFDFDGSVVNVSWTQTSGTPLAFRGESHLLEITGLRTGSFEFQLTVTDNNGLQSSDRVLIQVSDASTLPAITALVLLNGKTNEPLGNLSQGQVIDKKALGIAEINIQALATEGTASVKFMVNTDQNTRTMNAGPYFIKNQTTYPEWLIKNGTYSICATPYTRTYANGNPGVSQCFTFEVIDGTTSQPNQGKIRHEIWTGITGTNISSIPVNSPPTSITDLTTFETRRNIGDNYGSRIRGYVSAPIDGDYIFWIASDDKSELWLSTDEQARNKVRIAYVSTWTNPRQWDKLSTQQSVAMRLVGGRKYYIEALLKEGTGGDHLAVGWQLPNGTLERPITGTNLFLFEGAANEAPQVDITTPADGQTFTAPASIIIEATASDRDGHITKVEFHNGADKLGEALTAPYRFTWNNVPAGNYTLTAKAFDNADSSSVAWKEVTVSGGSTCSSTANIQMEIWRGISGRNITSIPFNTQPDSVVNLQGFETPSNIADNYGSRVRGYLCVAQSGSYTFWIASDDSGELWLSSNDDAANMARIAYVSGWTYARQWEKYSTQRSLPITLEAGRRYYVEARLKEGTGGDHLAIGWQLPDGTLQRPIAGSALSGFEPPAAGMLQSRIATMEPGHIMIPQPAIAGDDVRVHIFPNPVMDRSASLIIYGNKEGYKNEDAQIVILNITGQVVSSEQIRWNGSFANYSIPLSKDFASGVYLVNVTFNSRTISTRLFVK